jgi:peptidoglycan/LPS O-acetylase OafA/YrhL
MIPCSCNQMTSNPYQPIATPNSGMQVAQTPLGSARITGLTVSVLPAINEASIFWGHTEWLYWNQREMIPLAMKLWIIAIAVNLALFGFLIYAGFNTQIPWKLSVIVMLLAALAFVCMCLLGYRSLYYDMYVWSALILAQFACLALFRSSVAGKILVGVACLSGLGLYLFHMMISSLVT